jgi:ubiquinone/menaquinone biosynthesis C-methylase UbiE
MKDPRDLFSKQASTYSAFRPTYPADLYQLIYSKVAAFDNAWDCATGNGQVAKELSEKFINVFATDISESQLSHAISRPNIQYSQARAEATDFPDQAFDLITIGTALHWFDHDLFYKEVRRVAKPGAIIAAWAYMLCHCTAEIDRLTEQLYKVILEGYWDPERKYVEEYYRNIPFPVEEFPAPPFEIITSWTADQFIGYLNSWSSVQKFIDLNGRNPVSEVEDQIRLQFPSKEPLTFRFPLFLRIGRV